MVLHLRRTSLLPEAVLMPEAVVKAAQASAETSVARQSAALAKPASFQPTARAVAIFPAPKKPIPMIRLSSTWVKTKESLYFFPAFYAMKLELVPLKPYNR
jgi:hypothetical protein